MTSQTPQNSPRRPFHDPQTQQAAGKLNQPQTRYPARPATSQPATGQTDPSGGGNRRNVCTVDGSQAPAVTNDVNTAQTVTRSCLDASFQTPTDGRQRGQRPKRQGSGAGEFRFSIGETKQQKPKQTKIDRSSPRPCPHCGETFTPRATGRPPKYCSPYCRVSAFKQRQKS